LFPADKIIDNRGDYAEKHCTNNPDYLAGRVKFLVLGKNVVYDPHRAQQSDNP
jgi:hypothetical protein